jgi:hypothetical protein
MATRVASLPLRFAATPWVAFLGILTLSQTMHFLEHVAQIVQIHLLGLSGAAARGIVGQLDIEWVHFLWNAWVFLAIAAFVVRSRANAWLVAAAIIAAWHLTEHAVIMNTYLRTSVSGSPGLLSSGGLVGGGLPIVRPDLHFLYNLVETGLLIIGWSRELRVVSASRST